MQIQWTSVTTALPDEGKKVYVSGDDFVAQAYYHAGMYWQDANRGEQRYSLASVVNWAEVDHVQEVVDYVADKAMEHERYGLQYTPTETLEQMAVDYSNERWTTEEEVEAAYRGYLAGYCQALEINSSKNSAEILGDELTPTGWISVKDRLPEIDTDVLVKVSKGWVISDDNGDNPEPLTYDFYSVMSLYYQNNQYIWDTRPITDVCPLKWDQVTHWMPLPAALKGGK